MPDWLSIENFQSLAHQYRLIGTLLAIALPFLEAFFSFLPLAAFVVANASAYGLWWGFLFSWVGAVLGAYCVFLIVRKFGKSKIFRFVTEKNAVQKLIHWVEYQGFTPLFILLCFPFTPSALVNIVAGLSNLKKKRYLFTVMLAKFVMIFIISWIGSDLRALITNPIRTCLIIIIIVLLWWGGKQVEARLNEKIEKDMRKISKNRK
ncbi:TVP38/TMEM64 family protein [Rummeliibacillus pycnus]|uniref:TVP38/TMEM64 family protein n=1 Tax=Rummeliibacillus pycnus TaxID=101070 RepID=UPI000C9C399C|nr:TVP38/TMEM64 family protein [Rummeliibacillus pycnus]